MCCRMGRNSCERNLFYTFIALFFVKAYICEVLRDSLHEKLLLGFTLCLLSFLVSLTGQFDHNSCTLFEPYTYLNYVSK